MGLVASGDALMGPRTGAARMGILGATARRHVTLVDDFRVVLTEGGQSCAPAA